MGGGVGVVVVGWGGRVIGLGVCGRAEEGAGARGVGGWPWAAKLAHNCDTGGKQNIV